jgi:malonyl-CoA/methylmalonyl-CoA synthetase
MSAPGNLYSIFEACFPGERGRAFLETPGGRVYSYAGLEAAVGRLANLFEARGLRPGDRVVAQVGKTPAAVFLYLACLKAGLVYVPLNTAYEAGEVSYFAADAEPKAFVCAPDAEGRIRDLTAPACVVLTLGERGDGTLMAESAACAPECETAAVSADDLASIVYTSGTTGRPKGAMLSHGNLASNGQTLAKLWGFGAADVLLHALPIYHVHGLFVAINCVLLSGSAMLFLPRFDAAAITGLLPRTTVMMGVPTFYTRLLGEPAFDAAACENMRLFISGSAPLREGTSDAFTKRTGHVILERYGMSEAGMITSNPLNGARVGGTVGFALPDVAVRIAGEDGAAVAPGDVGGLEFRGPNLFKGYWRAPEKTTEAFCADGFFRSGDLAAMDAEGRVTIVGRSTDLIITGGLNVYPKEVEREIDALPGVAESSVVGMPDDDFGEAVAAAVVREPGIDITQEAILGALEGHLARFKLPRRIVFLDALPRNAMGKVQKSVLRANFETAANPR